MPCDPVKLVLFMPCEAPSAAAPAAALPAWGLLAAAALPGSVVGLACGVAGGMMAGGRAAAAVAALAAVAAAGMAGIVGIFGFGIFGISRAVLIPIISPYM